MAGAKATLISIVKRAALAAGLEVRRAPRVPVQPGSGPSGVFVDSRGNEFALSDDYRDTVKPGWRMMFAQRSEPERPDDATVATALHAVKQVNEFLHINDAGGVTIEGAHVLEVGCHAGLHAFTLASMGARHVDAIDVPEYGVRQASGVESSKRKLEEQSRWLCDLRHVVGLEFDPAVRDRVTFRDQDVVSLAERDVYDLVVSWETLEHLTAPQQAFDRMFQALRPGGLAFHDYNPFFAYNGGHSLCTLDFPYGHVRLDEGDFLRYVREHRPLESDRALAFYHHSLNRMSLADLMDCVDRAGFEMLELITWSSRSDGSVIDAEIVAQCQVHYPRLTLQDLLGTFVSVLLRKPSR